MDYAVDWAVLLCHFFSSVLLFCFETKLISFARLVTTVVDLGPPADWVKINVRETVSSTQIPSISSLCMYSLPLTRKDPSQTERLLWSLCFGAWAFERGGMYLLCPVFSSSTFHSFVMFYCVQMSSFFFWVGVGGGGSSKSVQMSALW